MIIDCVSDLHGAYPELEGGDLLIVAGDLTTNDSIEGYSDFYIWLLQYLEEYKDIIVIGGNHDNRLVNPTKLLEDNKFMCGKYLCDSGTEFEGLKIWGSPWTKRFAGQNSHCMAFSMKSELDLEKKWELVPNNTNILITHSPPYGILDTVNNRFKSGERVGSHKLLAKLDQLTDLKLHVFGHIHSGYGQTTTISHNKQRSYISVNAAHMNEDYEPVNQPIRIVL